MVDPLHLDISTADAFGFGVNEQGELPADRFWSKRRLHFAGFHKSRQLDFCKYVRNPSRWLNYFDQPDELKYSTMLPRSPFSLTERDLEQLALTALDVSLLRD
jgi:hypothetical protein